MTVDPDPTFMVDNMLGTLARWLRMLGYDSRYENDLSDDGIIDVSKKEHRRILTRDKALADRGAGLYIPTTSLDEQLLIVAKEFSLSFRPDRMRCSVCNGHLRKADLEEVKSLVPEKSLGSSGRFWRCDSCQKVYWDGTHWKGITERFRRLGLIGGDMQ